MEKYNESQLTKDKMDLNNRKVKKSSTLPRQRQQVPISMAIENA